MALGDVLDVELQCMRDIAMCGEEIVDFRARHPAVEAAAERGIADAVDAGQAGRFQIREGLQGVVGRGLEGAWHEHGHISLDEEIVDGLWGQGIGRSEAIDEHAGGSPERDGTDPFRLAVQLLDGLRGGMRSEKRKGKVQIRLKFRCGKRLCGVEVDIEDMPAELGQAIGAGSEHPARFPRGPRRMFPGREEHSPLGG